MLKSTALPLQVTIVLYLVVLGSLAIRSPYVRLFRGHNWDDKRVVLVSSTPNLTSVDFDNQAHTYNFHGTVILYNFENYNDAHPNAEIINVTFTTNYSFEATHPQLSMTSSVRFIGYNSESRHYPSITLFGQKNFGGLREELITGNKAALSYNDSISLINIGVNSWTFYNDINFNGKGDCVQGSSNEHGVRFLPNASAIGFSLKGKRSVEVGCYVRHGVPLAR